MNFSIPGPSGQARGIASLCTYWELSTITCAMHGATFQCHRVLWEGGLPSLEKHLNWLPWPTLLFLVFFCRRFPFFVFKIVFLDFLCFFCALFLFSKHFRGSAKRKTLAFLGAFPLFLFPKRQGLEVQGWGSKKTDGPLCDPYFSCFWLGVPKPDCFKLLVVCNLYADVLFCALLRPFALFCALLRTYVCSLLRTLALFCAHLRVSANDRV